MKMVCINNKNIEKELTIGRLYYDVYVEDNIYYHDIENDKNEYLTYQKNRFKALSEIRNDKIDKLLR